MDKRRQLLINHYKLIGEAMPIRYDNLPDPNNLDPVFQWWTPENYGNLVGYKGETNPYSAQALLFQIEQGEPDYEENKSPLRIFIPYWDIGSNRGYKPIPPSLKFLTTGEYMKQYDESNKKNIENIQDIYDKIDNNQLRRQYEKIKKEYVRGRGNEALLPDIKKFIETAITNYDNIQKAKNDKNFDMFTQRLKPNKKKSNDEVELRTKDFYDKAIEYQNDFVEEGSEKLVAPPRGKEDTSFIKSGKGKKGLSKKVILNILKNKTTKSNSAIKQLDTEIFKILNS
jgi:hypothetical protein